MWSETGSTVECMSIVPRHNYHPFFFSKKRSGRPLRPAHGYHGNMLHRRELTEEQLLRIAGYARRAVCAKSTFLLNIFLVYYQCSTDSEHPNHPSVSLFCVCERSAFSLNFSCVVVLFCAVWVNFAVSSVFFWFVSETFRRWFLFCCMIFFFLHFRSDQSKLNDKAAHHTNSQLRVGRPTLRQG